MMGRDTIADPIILPTLEPIYPTLYAPTTTKGTPDEPLPPSRM